MRSLPLRSAFLCMACLWVQGACAAEPAKTEAEKTREPEKTAKTEKPTSPEKPASSEKPANAAKGESDSFKVLYSSFTDGPFRAAEWVINNEEEWQDMFKGCEMEAHKKLQDDKHDFSKYVLVAVAPGALTYVPTEDSGIKDVTTKEKDVVVSYAIKNSGVRVFKGIQPLYLVRLPKSDKTISFSKKIDAE